MSWPEGIEARPIDRGDADAWAELLAAREKVDQEGENYSAQDLIDELEDPHVDPALDTIGLWADGQMVAYGKVYAADSFGFEERRYFFAMKRPLDQPVPEVPLAGGLRIVPFDRSIDELLRVTHNEIFRDHWGSTPKDPESWNTWFTGARAFRGGSSYVVLDGDTIAAYVLTYEWEADTEVTGIRELHLGQVGTVRSYRGRGLARAALAKVLAEAAQAGYQRAGLGVDADNQTGALGLYESLGFSVHNKWITYGLPL